MRGRRYEEKDLWRALMETRHMDCRKAEVEGRQHPAKMRPNSMTHSNWTAKRHFEPRTQKHDIASAKTT